MDEVFDDIQGHNISLNNTIRINKNEVQIIPYINAVKKQFHIRAVDQIAFLIDDHTAVQYLDDQMHTIFDYYSRKFLIGRNGKTCMFAIADEQHIVGFQCTDFICFSFFSFLCNSSWNIFHKNW